MEKKKILFVDDEIEIGLSFKELFEIHNIELRLASSIVEAKKLFLIENFTEVILDLNLPDGEGFDFVKWMSEVLDSSESETFIRPSIIIISGCFQMIDMKRARELGVCDILQKPFTLSHLLESLNNNSQYVEKKQAA